jgi:hypothetical protein
MLAQTAVKQGTKNQVEWVLLVWTTSVYPNAGRGHPHFAEQTLDKRRATQAPTPAC